MGKITAARGRVSLFVAFALFGLAACQDEVLGGEPRGASAFETLSRQVAASPVRAASWFQTLLPTQSALSDAKPVPLRADAGFLFLKGQAVENPVSTRTPSAARPPQLAPLPTTAAGDTAATPSDLGAHDGSSFLASQEASQPLPTLPAAPTLVIPSSPSEWFNPRGEHQGTEGIVADLAKLGVTDNGALYVNECWGRAWGASTSDHHHSQLRSWACDISVAGVQVPTPEAHEAARRIGSALGEPGWTGGNLRKTINGYRIQVLWMVAGHYNHVHIGARKL